MKRAYRVTWGGIVSIVAAETRGKAGARVMQSVREVYDPRQATWNSLRVVRAPEHGAWAEVDVTLWPWHEESLPIATEPRTQPLTQENQP